jgi:hypothetical protein
MQLSRLGLCQDGGWLVRLRAAYQSYGWIASAAVAALCRCQNPALLAPIPSRPACRPDESASELVMFGWSVDKQQLRKLGSVPLYTHIDAAGFGMPLRLSAVPKCPTGRPSPQHKAHSELQRNFGWWIDWLDALCVSTKPTCMLTCSQHAMPSCLPILLLWQA